MMDALDISFGGSFLKLLLFGVGSFVCFGVGGLATRGTAPEGIRVASSEMLTTFFFFFLWAIVD